MILSGDNVHVRGMIELLRTESDDDRATGWHTVIVNGNWMPMVLAVYGQLLALMSMLMTDIGKVPITGKIDENGMTLKMRGRGVS